MRLITWLKSGSRDENNNFIGRNKSEKKKPISYAHSADETYASRDTPTQYQEVAYANSEDNNITSGFTSGSEINEEIALAINDVINEPKFKKKLATKYIAKCLTNGLTPFQQHY